MICSSLHVHVYHAITCIIDLISFFPYFSASITVSTSSIHSPQVPLDMLLLQCNVPVDIQEIEKSTAVISYSPPDPKVL